jgi:methionyl-tRNA formyltransferase
MLENVAILAADTCRSRIYLQHLNKKNLLPSNAIVLSQASDLKFLSTIDEEILQKDNLFSYDLRIPINNLLEELNISQISLNCDDPNSMQCKNEIGSTLANWIIYSGPGGKILSKETLNLGKKFLHAHPGLLPKYKGSTTIYFSLLTEGFCGASAFIMDDKIDNGPTLMQKKFPPPVERRNIDLFYDSYIRAELLAEVLSVLDSPNTAISPQPTNMESRTYHIIHPILKSIAIYGKDQ